MMQHFDHVSYEMVCSGIGIPHIYAYLRDSGFAPESPDIAGDLAGAADLTPIIVQGAFRSSPCSLCSTTVETFVSILAAEAGNMAVKLLATGGVYLSGGLPLHVLPALERGRFVEVFRNKGRFSELMSRIPIHVVLHRTALTGAARYAFDRMRSEALHPAELAAAGVETEQQ
jgi:glucokinase